MPTLYIDNKSILPKRREMDFYPTPLSLCRTAVNTILPEWFTPTYAFDPGYGTGVWGMAVKERFPNVVMCGCEVRDVEPPKAYDIWLQGKDGDFLARDWLESSYDLIIGNPPYKHAEAFLDKSLEMVQEDGFVLFLFKLSILEGQYRFSKYYSQGLNPKSVWVSSRRVSFTGDKKSNADAYALYLWQKGYQGKTELNWLNWEY